MWLTLNRDTDTQASKFEDNQDISKGFFDVVNP